MSTQSPSATVIEILADSLEAASAYNPGDAERPAAVLWTDPDSRWQPIVPQLRPLLPQILVLGEYRPEERTGPAIWLRCVIDRALEPPGFPTETTPIVYLAGAGRQEISAAGTCPERLKPLVELQYRGVCWTQKNGRDWTVEAFLTSRDGGLDLDVARDAATRQSMLRALTELAATPVTALRGRRLEAEDFDRLFSDDPVRDVLVWLSDPAAVRTGWDAERWNAFGSCCKADLGFDPEKDGETVAAERLGRREGAWASVWRRFAESPALYPGLPDLLRRAMPDDPFAEPLFAEPSSWPQHNEGEEAALRRALLELGGNAPSEARDKILSLEGKHGKRRGWVWAKLGQAPLACALAHLATLALRTSSGLGGASAAEMAGLYAEGAWEIDAAALHSMAAVQSYADGQAVSAALDAIYRPWLESAARRLQTFADAAPLPGPDAGETPVFPGEVPFPGKTAVPEEDAVPGSAARGTPVPPGDDTSVGPGTVVLFADALRFDVAQRLLERLQTKGRAAAASTRWAALPTVTATAKPAVSPVADRIEGLSLGEDFLPAAVDGERPGRPLTTDRFRALLDAAGCPYITADETGDPSGRAWTEHGEIDEMGHSLQGRLAARIDEQVDLLAERIDALLRAGWREVRVVTDHGWLWLPGGLPKVDLPKYLTRSRWARCAAVEGGAAVEVPTVPWHWNARERVAVGPGIACFSAGNEYAHGGVSLQECLAPVIRVSAGAAAAKAETDIAAVSWVGLRCRVRLGGAAPGLSVDLRTQVNDPGSSVSGGARPVEDEGAASLLVPDDEHEGTPAAVVVLDAGGQVLARQSTIIGGED